MNRIRPVRYVASLSQCTLCVRNMCHQTVLVAFFYAALLASYSDDAKPSSSQMFRHVYGARLSCRRKVRGGAEGLRFLYPLCRRGSPCDFGMTRTIFHVRMVSGTPMGLHPSHPLNDRFTLPRWHDWPRARLACHCKCETRRATFRCIDQSSAKGCERRKPSVPCSPSRARNIQTLCSCGGEIGRPDRQFGTRATTGLAWGVCDRSLHSSRPLNSRDAQRLDAAATSTWLAPNGTTHASRCPQRKGRNAACGRFFFAF